MKKSVPGVPVEPFVEEFNVKPTFDEDGVQVSSGIGLDGREHPDPVPMSPPVGVAPPVDLMAMIRTMVHHEAFMRLADEEGFDTFEEAGDFDVDDDPPDPMTPHERLFYPPDERKDPPQGAATPSVAPVAPLPPKAPEGVVSSPPPGPPTPPPTSTST